MRLKICYLMPRGSKFTVHGANSIDLCVADLVRHSAHRNDTIILCDEIKDPFHGVATAFLAKCRNYVTRTFNAARQIWSIRPDIVVVEQHLPTAFLLSWLVRAPIVLHAHNFQKAKHGGWSGFYKKRQYRALRGVIFVSEACRGHFRSHYGEDVPSYVVPNGLPGLDHPSQEVATPLTCKWPTCGCPERDVCRPVLSSLEQMSSTRPGKERNIIVVGRAVPEKGILEAAKSLQKVGLKRRNWSAVFILSEADRGSPYFREVMSALSSLQNCRVLFDLPHKTVMHHYQRSEVALVLSRWNEPFGRTALEAHFAECALVSSGRGGLREVSGDAAIYVDPEDVSGVADAVVALLEQDQRRIELARQGAIHAKENFDISLVSRLLDRRLDEVSQNWRRPSASKGGAKENMPNLEGVPGKGLG